MKSKAESGYTILEAMLFITISSSMFILAMISFSGRQQQVQFTQAVRELDAKILDTINDVTTGYFPNDGSLQCSISASPRPVISVAAVEKGQGTNDDCVMVGKAVQFYPDDGISNTEDQSLMYTYNIVGKRVTSGGESTQSLEEARPVTTSPTAASAGINDTTEKAELKYGLRVTKVATEEAASVESSVIGFFTRFTRTYKTTKFSEGQTVSSSIIPGVSRTDPHSQYAAATRINTITDNPITAVAGDTLIITTSSTPIVICLADNDMERRASITIGGTGQASTRVDFDTYNRTICGA